MRRRRRRSEGLALVVVLWIAALLTVAMFAALFAARAEAHLASAFERERELDHVALSGIEFGIGVLLEDPTPHAALGDAWAQSEELFRDRRVGRGTFSLVRPKPDGTAGAAYGIADEASLLNLNHASWKRLASLEGLAEPLAQAAADWRDDDSEPLPQGSEDQAKNAPFETPFEPLMVRGWTPEALLGPARNLEGGLLRRLTVHATEPNVDLEGRPRVNLNAAPEAELRAALSAGFTEDQIRFTLDARRSRPFESVAELAAVPGVERAHLQPVYDRLTVDPRPALHGRVNVNTAPAEVLKALGVLPDGKIDQILAARTADPDVSNPAWLLEVLDDAEFVAAAPLLTTRSAQFRVDVVARLDGEPWFKRVLAIVDIDRGAGKARILYFRDISDLRVPTEPTAP
jgi:type II secretory pathway component PulK